MIGFIGQGWIGKNMADDFEERGFEVVRYSLEERDDRIRDCEIVFIAVPTPTTPKGFDISAVLSALTLVGNSSTAVIKSTIIPGTTRKLQKLFPNLVIMHSPEFLREKHAVEDTRNPKRTIIGLVEDSHREAASKVAQVLPTSPYNRTVTAESAECIKYIGNSFLYTKVVFFNMMYDMVNDVGAHWHEVRESVVADERIGASHTTIDEDGRGAGGHCFIKDFEALIGLFNEPSAVNVLQALKTENNRLLMSTNKDIDLLTGVYVE